jgi:hypothetical protein
VRRPTRKNDADNGLQLSSIRHRIESVFQTCKDILTLERHAAHTLPQPHGEPYSASSRSRPASTSTTGSDDRAARSWHSWLERVESSSSGEAAQFRIATWDRRP